MLSRLFLAPRGLVAILLLPTLVVQPSQSVRAQDKARGEELARSLCAKCHFAVGHGELTGRSGVPTFTAIAKRQGQTFEGVVRWLRSSPSIMPNHHLTQNEILDLAAYVMSLRGKP